MTTSAIRIAKLIAKSTNATMIDAAGKIIRGKYIFEMRLALTIMLLLDSVRAFAKNCHGIIAEKTRIG